MAMESSPLMSLMLLMSTLIFDQGGKFGRGLVDWGSEFVCGIRSNQVSV